MEQDRKIADSLAGDDAEAFRILEEVERRYLDYMRLSCLSSLPTAASQEAPPPHNTELPLTYVLDSRG
jgi:hypothetical protein